MCRAPKKEMLGLDSSSFGIVSDVKKKEDWTEKAKTLGSENVSKLTTESLGINRVKEAVNVGDSSYKYASNVGEKAIGKASYEPPKRLGEVEAVYKQTAGVANSDGTYERGLIHELCQPGGMRPIPPKDKLLQFTKHSRTLDPLLIGPILLSKLNDENWQVQMKCLYVIESVLTMEGCEPYKNYFKTNMDEIDYLIENGKSQIQKKSKEIKDIVFDITVEKEILRERVSVEVEKVIVEEKEEISDLFGGLSIQQSQTQIPVAVEIPKPVAIGIATVGKNEEESLFNDLDFGSQDKR